MRGRSRPKPVNRLPRNAGEILREHVTLELDCTDQTYRNAYRPRLQYESGVAPLFRYQQGHPFASSALMESISKAPVPAIHTFAQKQGVPLIAFKPR